MLLKKKLSLLFTDLVYILTLHNVSLDKLDPAHHISAFVEGEFILSGWHFGHQEGESW